jgi:hypothetical protein
LPWRASVASAQSRKHQRERGWRHVTAARDLVERRHDVSGVVLVTAQAKHPALKSKEPNEAAREAVRVAVRLVCRVRIARPAVEMTERGLAGKVLGVECERVPHNGEPGVVAPRRREDPPANVCMVGASGSTARARSISAIASSCRSEKDNSCA